MPNFNANRAPEQSAQPDILRAALAYARRGWPVFVLHPERQYPPGTAKHLIFNKRPIHGYKYRGRGTRWAATTDPDQIREDFRRDPDALVGIAGGLDARDPRANWMREPVPSSGAFFLDIDKTDSHEHDGDPHLALLAARHWPLPDTLTSIGLNGGRHMVFRCPSDRKVVSRPLFDERGERVLGVDVKGEGGYVVAPPSRGRRWIDWRVPIADAPPWLLDIVCREDPIRPKREKVERPARIRRTTAVADPPPQQDNREQSAEMLALMIEDAGRGVYTDDDLLKVQYALDAIHNTKGRIGNGEWAMIGAAIYNVFGDEGFALWDEFSQRHPSYDADYTEHRWQYCSGYPGIDGVAKIVAIATEHEGQRFQFETNWYQKYERALRRRR